MRKKWKNKAGTSMILALLFLLFCFTMGSIALTAASVNPGRSARIYQEQQDYLSVASATELLRNSLSSMVFTGYYTETYTYLTTFPDPIDKYDSSISGPYYAFSHTDPLPATWNPLLSPELETLFQAKWPLSDDVPTSVLHRLTLEPSREGMAVSISLCLQEDYSIDVVLWNWSEDADARPRNQMHFTLLPSVVTEPAPMEEENRSFQASSYTTLYATTVTWTVGDVMKGGLT